MEMAAAPQKVVDACRSFLTFSERIEWFLRDREDEGGDSQGKTLSWLKDICRPNAFEVDGHLKDAVVACGSRNTEDEPDERENGSQRIDVYKNVRLLQLILSEDAFASVRFAKVSLAEALRRYEKRAALGRSTAKQWAVVLEVVKYIDELPSEDRASSYVLVSKLEQNASELLDEFPVDVWMYPPESYHELLVAACTAGHTSMVAELLENCVTPPFENGGELLTSAVRYNHLDVVQQLGAAGQIPSDGAAIVNGLRLACTRGSISMVDTLLAHYSSSSNAWDHHPTLLRSAVQSDNLQVVKLLLECDPRGAFIRMDQLIEQLEREIKSGANQTPQLDAIVGMNGYVAWDLSAFEGCVQKNDTVLFDLLVNHIEWNHDDLNTALATATTNENEHMAKIIRLLLQSIPDESEATPLKAPVFAPGDKVEARKRGRATFSSAVINRCYLNGTYDVKFIESAGEESVTQEVLGSRARTALVKVEKVEKVEKELHPQMIRRRSVRKMTRIDTSFKENDKVESSSNNQQHQKQSDVPRVQESIAAEAALYDPSASPFAENDDDDRAIRADAAIIRKREEDDYALQPELFTLADSEDEELPSISSSSGSDSVDKLLVLKLNSSEQQIKANGDGNQDCRNETERVCFAEGDAVEARYRSSKEFYSAKVTFCHTSDLFDLEYDDGDQDTLVPRDAIRRSSKGSVPHDNPVDTNERDATQTGIDDTGGAAKEPDSFDNVPKQAKAVDDAPLAIEYLSLGSDAPLYAVGDIVEVNFLDMGKFHRGRIVQLHQDVRTYDIQYTNFEEIEAGVSEGRIRAPAIGKHSSKDLLPYLNSGIGSGRSRKSTSKSQRNSLRTSFLTPTAVVDGAAAAASTAVSNALAAPSLPGEIAKRSQSTRPLTTSSSSRSRTQEKQIVTARKGGQSNSNKSTPSISWRELEEWKNVDLILNRKRRFLNSQSGGIESVKVPWGEEFAAIQSLKRFAMQHPDVLRAHM